MYRGLLVIKALDISGLLVIKDGHTWVGSCHGVRRVGFIDRRIKPLVGTPDSRGQLRSDIQTARFFVLFCGAGSSPPVVSTAVARKFEEKSAGLPAAVYSNLGCSIFCIQGCVARRDRHATSPTTAIFATSRRRSRPLALPQESRPPAPENRPLSRFRTPSDPPNSPARGGSRPPPELTLARPVEDLSKRSRIRRSGPAWQAWIACGTHSVRSAKIFEDAGGATMVIP